MMLQKIVISITSIVLLMSLNNCSTVKEPIVIPILESSVLQDGMLNGAGEEGFSQEVLKITSAEHWKKVEEKLSTTNPFESSFNIHQIDFENTNLYLYTDKVRSTGGYKLTMSDSRKNGELYNFNILIKKPVGSAAEVITQPFLIFTTNKTEEEQRFTFLEY